MWYNLLLIVRIWINRDLAVWISSIRLISTSMLWSRTFSKWFNLSCTNAFFFFLSFSLYLSVLPDPTFHLVLLKFLWPSWMLPIGFTSVLFHCKLFFNEQHWNNDIPLLSNPSLPNFLRKDSFRKCSKIPKIWFHLNEDWRFPEMAVEAVDWGNTD